MQSNPFIRSSAFGLSLLSALALSACGVSGKRSSDSDTFAQALAPLLSIDAPIEGTFITVANYETFTLSGSCGYDGGTVTAQTDGPVIESTVCAGNTWSIPMDVSFVFDGLLTFNVTHTGPLGEATIPVSRSYVKDTLSPTDASILIGDGVMIPTTPAVVLTLEALDATQMYITNTAGCATGGVLEAYNTAKNWTLEPVGSTATVYAIFSDDAGNSSACVSATTTVNFVTPIVGTVAINGGAASTTTTSAILTLNALGAADMYITNDSGCATGGVFEPYATSKNWTLGQIAGAATVYAAFRDADGNVGPCASDQIFVGAQPLAISPASIALPSSSAQATTFTASGGTLPYVFTVLSGEGSVDASTGLYTVAAGAMGTTLIRVTDAANVTADAVITHSNQINLTGCYNLQVIGMMKPKTASLTDSNRHSIFVNADGTSNILLSDGPFGVLDGNGTDGPASFSLPSDTSGYSVYIRLVGKPASGINLKSCGVDPLDPTSTYCSQTSLSIDRSAGTSEFQDASEDLLAVYADIDADGGVDRVPLFGSGLDGSYWNTDSEGRVHAQLKFCPIQL